MALTGPDAQIDMRVPVGQLAQEVNIQVPILGARNQKDGGRADASHFAPSAARITRFTVCE